MRPATPALAVAEPPAMEDTVNAVPTLESFLASVEHRAYRFALYELRDRDAALDAVQDSMCRLAERYAERPAAEWPALFFTILRNRATDAKRWRVVQNLRGLLTGSRPDAVDSESVLDLLMAPTHERPDAQLATKEQRRALERALTELPTRQRQVFLLREWQGLTTAETAQTLGCSIGTIKQHHFRALQALRERLSEVWHE
ncbi:MAG: RNA polymerase sigma factor [Gammaproteobacteria bacterium]|nr:RNA polymerase sigma factor [Gammaproteobacteria bacterium]